MDALGTGNATSAAPTEAVDEYAITWGGASDWGTPPSSIGGWGEPVGGGWSPAPSTPTPRPNWAGLVIREGVEQVNVELADIRIQVDAEHIVSPDGWYTEHSVTVRDLVDLMIVLANPLQYDFPSTLKAARLLYEGRAQEVRVHRLDEPAQSEFRQLLLMFKFFGTDRDDMEALWSEFIHDVLDVCRDAQWSQPFRLWAVLDRARRWMPVSSTIYLYRRGTYHDPGRGSIGRARASDFRIALCRVFV